MNKIYNSKYICNIEHNRYNLKSWIIAIHIGPIFIFDTVISLIWAEWQGCGAPCICHWINRFIIMSIHIIYLYIQIEDMRIVKSLQG